MFIIEFMYKCGFFNQLVLITGFPSGHCGIPETVGEEKWHKSSRRDRHQHLHDLLRLLVWYVGPLQLTVKPLFGDISNVSFIQRFPFCYV